MQINEEKLKEIIERAQKLLDENDNWKVTYENYADLMLKYKGKKEELSHKLREWEPLKFYLKLGDSKSGSKSLKLSVRYLGQAVAIISVKDSGVYISTKGYNSNNRDHFGCTTELDNEEWTSPKAKEFRAYFRDNKPTRNNVKKHNDEHRIESMLLTEFLKTSSKDKLLCGIQPVTFIGYRFPMATEIKSSEISEHSNVVDIGIGHIDIFARTKDRKMVVFELKDKNEEGESVENLLQQATGYAVFLLNLLRSPFGEKWYKIFGFSGVIKDLTIKVCSAMPHKENGESDKFEVFRLPCGKDMIEYHWLYFEEDGEKITNIDTNLNDK